MKYKIFLSCVSLDKRLDGSSTDYKYYKNSCEPRVNFSIRSYGVVIIIIYYRPMPCINAILLIEIRLLNKYCHVGIVLSDHLHLKFMIRDY
jgi:hypothetical protein